jgi:type II secretory pathway component GspD/PulD (secretin)
VVISRYQGEKRLSNLPFTLTVNATQRTNLRMGAEVPIPRSTMKEGALVSSYEYRRIGTMIDCSAGSVQDDGRVALSLTIDDSQVSLEDGSTGSQTKGLPRFHSFTSTATLTLRDGQTMQYTAGSDKVTGEVVRVEVTLNLVK